MLRYVRLGYVRLGTAAWTVDFQYSIHGFHYGRDMVASSSISAWSLKMPLIIVELRFFCVIQLIFKNQ